MSIVFRCKCCGAGLEFEKNATVVKCEYCGVMQTLPKIDDERRRNLYERANHFRQNGEFDKAIAIYEQVLNEDGTDAEAYWSLVLCRYGVEYVEDPATHRRVPTVNRTQPVPVISDGDYKKALEYADSSQAGIYKSEAKQIDEIQRGILEISRREKPFDVFICYKESDANGQRTVDSVLAVDLYEKLTKEGFKVFCSRVTLEDKLGQKYEPYIFAALNSAPVLIALGTRPEYFNAVWVRNEWSRFLMLMKNGAEKTLIPAYRDMSPYDLPEEFVNLQAQDMSKIGFMQDLVRGIRKIIRSERSEAPKTETVIVNGGSGNADSLLKRAFIFLEDGDFDNAENYCERLLDIDPENAAAYLGKLMIEKRVRYREDLAYCAEPFDGSSNYQKAVKYGDPAIISELEGYIAEIKNRIEQARIEAQRRAEQARIEEAKKAKAVIMFYAAVAVVAVIVCAVVSHVIYNYYYASSLIRFSEKGDVQAVIKSLSSGADVRAKGGTALILAARESHAEVVKILLDAGAGVNAKQEDGNTALMGAAYLDSAEVVKILLDAGADVNAKDNDGETALMSTKNAEVVKILLDAGADVNAKDKNGRTALMRAAEYKSAEVVNVLLDAGANVNARDKDGKRPVDHARENEYLKGTDVLKRLERLSR
ncbi:MAG: ankyrin repeat domain-containing protein [Synergistaceae bacterium]|nr:ankyrin repeat domain-containing protein [Synergistaceae bacterium]